MTTCKNCGSEIADTAKFCLRCGGKVEKLKEDNTLCPSCNKEFPRGYKFCPFCGVRFNNKAKSEEKEECINRPAETSMKSNTVAAVEQEHVSKEVSAFVTADSTFSGQAQSSSPEPISAEYIEEKTSCPSCKAMLPAKDKKFCPNCGVNIEEARKTLEPAKCLLCGAELAPNIKFCPVCGARRIGGQAPVKSAYSLDTIKQSTHAEETGGNSEDLSMILLALAVFLIGLIAIVVGAITYI